MGIKKKLCLEYVPELELLIRWTVVRHDCFARPFRRIVDPDSVRSDRRIQTRPGLSSVASVVSSSRFAARCLAAAAFAPRYHSAHSSSDMPRNERESLGF